MFTSFVSSRSLRVRGSRDTAPSVFWYGAPGGTQGPLGKGGRTAAGRAARSIAKGQHDSSGGCVRRDDADKVPQAHFYVGTADRVPLPRCGEGGRGCGAERRQWRMQRGGAPVAVEKIEQASSAKIFSGTARRWGQIRRSYLWSVSVRSTDLDFSSQKNLNP